MQSEITCWSEFRRKTRPRQKLKEIHIEKNTMNIQWFPFKYLPEEFLSNDKQASIFTRSIWKT